MKTSKKKIEEKPLSGSPTETLDPFAVDFFGGEKQSRADDSNEGLGNAGRQKKSNKGRKLSDVKSLDWYKQLPKMSKREAEFSNRLTELPKLLSVKAQEGIKKTFSRFTLLDEELIHCEILGICEVNLKKSIDDLRKTPQIFLTLLADSKSESSVVAINSEFASALIDLVLGGKGKSSEYLRPLSPVEQTVIEFLVINILGELNNGFDNSRLCLGSIGNAIEDDFKKEERGAEVVLDFVFGNLSGSVTLLLPMAFPELMGESKFGLFRHITPIEKFDKFNTIGRNLSLSVDFGKTEVSANDITFLEKDDVVLIEKPSNIYEDGVVVFVGDGTNYSLSGRVQTQNDNDETDILSREILIEVQEVLSEKEIKSVQQIEKMSTEQQKEAKSEEGVADGNESVQDPNSVEADENRSEEQINETFEDDIDEETLESLENVMINLRVSLGGRRLNLEELRNIRVGQIIELGCRPSDPVDIVTDSDNKPIARGELLEVEGQMGVRLTRIFV